MKAIRIVLAVVVVALWANAAFGDGFLVVERRDVPIYNAYNVKYHRVTVEIEDQIARTTIDQVFENPSKRTIEATYIFPIPAGASISSFSMFIGDTELKGTVLDKDEARKIYEEIVRKKKDPALLEYIGTGLVKTSVFPIPPGESRTNRIVYEEVLRRDGDLVEYVYPLNTEKFSAQNLEEVSVNVSISSKTPIKTVYSPTHDVRVERFTDYRATAGWTERNTKPDIDYRLYYSTAEKDLGASLICYRPDPGKPGYFLLLVSPRTEIDESKIAPKNLICVIDRSGSMSGEKIEQAKGSLKFILNSLNQDDRFALISYNDTVDVMNRELLAYSEASRNRALGYVDALKANGGTNIRDALVEALKLTANGDRPNIIIFLTDGLPTVGETRIERIVEAVGKANEIKARLFTFGVGYDVNAVLLDKLSSGNHGVSEYVRPDEDIEVKVSSFYAKVQSPILTDITVDYGNELVSDVYPRELPDLFKGGQLVLAGRYGGSAKATLIIKGKLEGAERAFEYPLEYKAETDRLANNFVARLWATKRIGFLLDEMRLHGRNQELIDEVVRLSKEFGVITEYTSFLVTEDVELAPGAAVERADAEMDVRFKADTGAHGVGQAQNARRMRESAQVNVGNEYYDEKGGVVRYNRVRNIGDRAFYNRQGFWVDATYDEETQKPIEVVQFSEEFFELSRKLGRDNQYLSFASNIIVNVEGQAYKIVPPESPDDEK